MQKESKPVAYRSAEKLRRELEKMAASGDLEFEVLAECVLRLDRSARRDFARLKALEQLVQKELGIKRRSRPDGA